MKCPNVSRKALPRSSVVSRAGEANPGFLFVYFLQSTDEPQLNNCDIDCFICRHCFHIISQNFQSSKEFTILPKIIKSLKAKVQDYEIE